MNYLAHLYLSGDDTNLLIGNFIGDAVKGNQFENYPPLIARGILLHRFIDDFSDHHPSALETRKRLRPDFGLWSPVVTDMFYDHFLAANWSLFSDRSLEDYTGWVYGQLRKNKESLPPKMERLLFYMSQSNWLLGYATVDGVAKSLSGMSQRIEYDNNLDEAAIALRANYNLFRNDFLDFFPQMKNAVKDYLQQH